MRSLGRSENRMKSVATARGYTLIELMITVVIAGVLVTLAIYSIRVYIYATKTAEATNMIGFIKAAQENYRDETFRYLDVSGSLDVYYPLDPLEQDKPTKAQWGGDFEDADLASRWRSLGVQTNAPVQFGYACEAGNVGDTVPQPGDPMEDITWPAVEGPWFVVKALGDLDGDKVPSVYVGSSFSDEIFQANDGE